MRVVEPQRFDFVALADGVVRNNVGVAGIAVEADVRFEDGHAVFVRTGQRVPFEGAAPPDGRTRLVVRGWLAGQRTVLSAAPGADRAAGDGARP